MCPPSRLFTAAARSRLTWRRRRRAQARPVQRLAHHVGGELTVWQHLHHRQADAVHRDRVAVAGVAVTTGPRMTNRAESRRSSLPTTSPSSSTIPVNTPTPGSTHRRAPTLYDAAHADAPQNTQSDPFWPSSPPFSQPPLLVRRVFLDRRSSRPNRCRTLPRCSRSPARPPRPQERAPRADGRGRDQRTADQDRSSGDLTNTPAVAAQGKANSLFLASGSRASTSSVVDGDLYGALTPTAGSTSARPPTSTTCR